MSAPVTPAPSESDWVKYLFSDECETLLLDDLIREPDDTDINDERLSSPPNDKDQLKTVKTHVCLMEAHDNVHKRIKKYMKERNLEVTRTNKSHTVGLRYDGKRYTFRLTLNSRMSLLF
jgi:hypothetical protein